MLILHSILLISANQILFSIMECNLLFFQNAEIKKADLDGIKMEKTFHIKRTQLKDKIQRNFIILLVLKLNHYIKEIHCI